MALSKYTPGANKIVHVTAVDFSARPTTFSPVRLVQYDNKLPIIEVKMYNNGLKYAAPSTATANIRFGKHGTFVNKAALGWNDDRTSLYFEVSQQMVTQYGKFAPVIELVVGSETAASSAILVIVDKNPIQNSDVEDQTEFKTLESYVEDAKQYANQAAASKNAAATSESNASKKATEAEKSKTAAGEYAAQALASKNNAAASAGAAKSSENLANTAKTEAQKAQKAIENLKVQSSTLAAGSNATVSKSVADDGVTLYFGIPRGAQGATGPQGKQGIQGPAGPQGPKGESGVTTPTAAWFTLSVDADGNLWAYYADSTAAPPLEYNKNTGELFYVVPDGAA